MKEKTINDDPSLVLREEEKTLKEKRKNFIEDMNYALSKFDWANSFLDAEAIDILNTWKNTLIDNEEKAIERLKEELFHRLVSYNMEIGGLIVRENEKKRLIEEEVNKIFGEEK